MATKDDIEAVSEIDGISDTDGKDDFTETGQVDTEEPQKASGAKYDSFREAYRSKEGFWKGIGEVIRNTVAGQNTVGRVTGVALDIATLVMPQGSKIDRLRAKGKNALNLNSDKNDMKDAFKGLVSKEAWKKILVFTDDNGNFSFQESLTTIVQLIAIVGALYAADYFGVLEPLMKILQLS